MRFLFLANTHPNPDEGASGCDLATIGALRELGHEVDDIWLGDRTRRIRHNNLHLLGELPFWFRDTMLERCRDASYDVVQISQPHGWLAARAHREHALPGVFVIRSHGWEPCAWAALKRHGSDRRPVWRKVASDGLRIFLARSNRLSLRHADGVVVYSQEELEYLRVRADAERILALPPGVPDSFFSEARVLESDRWRRVLFVGSHSEHKAPEVVARVLKILASHGPDMEFTWVTQASAHDAVRSLLGEASGRVRLLGWMPREHLLSVYDKHGFYLQPSHYEGYCIAFLEAMARGCCVLATNISGPGEKIVRGSSGFLFDRGDAEGIARTILDLAARPDGCAAISRQARRAAEGMTWKATAERFASFCGGLRARKEDE